MIGARLMLALVLSLASLPARADSADCIALKKAMRIQADTLMEFVKVASDLNRLNIAESDFGKKPDPALTELGTRLAKAASTYDQNAVFAGVDALAKVCPKT